MTRADLEALIAQSESLAVAVLTAHDTAGNARDYFQTAAAALRAADVELDRQVGVTVPAQRTAETAHAHQTAASHTEANPWPVIRELPGLSGSVGDLQAKTSELKTALSAFHRLAGAVRGDCFVHALQYNLKAGAAESARAWLQTVSATVGENLRRFRAMQKAPLTPATLPDLVLFQILLEQWGHKATRFQPATHPEVRGSEADTPHQPLRSVLAAVAEAASTCATTCQAVVTALEASVHA